MSHYKKHLAIAFILCFVGYLMAEPFKRLVMNYINPSQIKVGVISLAQVTSVTFSFNFYFGLFIAGFYMLDIWQRNQRNFKWHFSVSVISSAVVIFVTMHYYRLKMLQFDQIMADLSKSIPSLSRSVPLPDISMIPLMGLIFIVFYFCLRMFFVTHKQGCCNNI